MSNKILYDLGISVSAITLWLTPSDITRAAGYSLSILFSGRAYYTGLITLAEERKTDEKQAISYEADLDFADQLLGAHIDSQLEVKTLQIENAKLQQLIPLVHINQQLEKQLQQLNPPHPEMTEEDREKAAKAAIDGAFVGGESKSDRSSQISEEDIRKQFPEQMDATSWKAILKALQHGASKDEIVKDVLGCSDSSKDTGKAYFEYLKSKFLG
ncbi:MAG TPA: hypothetical protein V6C90_25975 [Coleofasciculaceae cyanobacterium]|jgi:hypothetical protein